MTYIFMAWAILVWLWGRGWRSRCLAAELRMDKLERLVRERNRTPYLEYTDELEFDPAAEELATLLRQEARWN
jgi:hypothetical protein